jgi:hypothetical protein
MIWMSTSVYLKSQRLSGSKKSLEAAIYEDLFSCGVSSQWSTLE